jgi:hypothetical protein
MEEQLAALMDRHGLLERRAVLSVPGWQPIVQLNHRQVADRIFASGRPVPKRIFVGCGVDHHAFLTVAAGCDGLRVSSLAAMGGMGRPERFPYGSVRDVPVADLSVPLVDASDAVIGCSVEDNIHCFVRSREGALLLREVSLFHNLIGDHLCDLGEGQDPNPVPVIYEQGGTVPAETRERLDGAGRILRTVIASCQSGWIDVVRCNEKLCFLRDSDGGYDFVFRQMRTVPFRSEGLADFEDGEERFARWLYFRYPGWLERDQHVAETEFYEAGGNRARYNGDTILRDHLTRSGTYTPKARVAAPAPEKGFATAPLGHHGLCFSELVTVDEFRRFIKLCVGYNRRRRRVDGIEDWSPVNHPSDGGLPASVTWHDAKAYARWYGSVHRLPVRLASEEEYVALAAGLAPDSVAPEDLRAAFVRRLGRFFDPQGIPFDGHPPYMARDEFDRWGFRYIPSAVEWAVSETGMKVLRSAWFGEWLQPKGAAVNGQFLCSQHGVGAAAHVRASAETDRFSDISTGKYKSMRIGFRLVYETEVQK